MNKIIYLKIILIIFISLLSINTCISQWIRCGIQNGGTVYSLYSKDNNVFAGVCNNGIFLSTNNGSNWMQTALNNRSVYSICFSSVGIFAGTSVHGVYYSSDYGMNWVQTSLSQRTITSLIESGCNILAGSDGYGIFLTSNNGTNWVQTSLNNRNINSMTMNINFVYAGLSTYGVFRSSDNGVSWVQTSLYNQTVYSLITNDDYLFAGTWNNGIFYTSNNGLNWIQTSLNNKTIYSMSIIGNILFAGSGGDGVYITKNFGLNWLQFNEGFTLSPKIYSLSNSNNYIYASSDSQSVWRRYIPEIVGKQNESDFVINYFLYQNYPNPFNPNSKIKFQIASEDAKLYYTKIIVYDLTGKEVSVLVDEQLRAGMYVVDFDASELSSGVYYYKLIVGEFKETKKMVFIR